MQNKIKEKKERTMLPVIRLAYVRSTAVSMKISEVKLNIFDHFHETRFSRISKDSSHT